ncbi:MAG: DUF664 domain-containing protein [Ilumatobacteraceae bacterium]
MDVRDLNDGELFDSLEWNRSVVVRKLDGLTFEKATELVTPTGLTLLGVLRHLAWCERGWFGHFFRGEAGADDVQQQQSLEARSVLPHDYFGIVTLRWIVLHMTKETARHAGHLDILRELTDGRTGY